MTRASPELRSPSGFSLIEAVIAIAIAGIAFLVLTETFFNVLLTLERLDGETDFQKNARFVRTQIIQLASRDDVEAGGEISTLDHGAARWNATIGETAVADLFRLDLEIEFDNPEGERIPWAESLFLLRPTWSDPIERSALLTEARREIEAEDLRRDW